MRPAAPLLLPCCVLACLGPLAPGVRAAAVPTPQPAQPQAMQAWRVEDVRRGMKGHGRTVMKGTKVETFHAEVLGVLKNTSPGRDLVLARLSGLGLEKSGVIAGMSGSPVYVEGKLLGAVAYAWAFGKEPIAGITPYGQMSSFVEALERRVVATPPGKPVRVGLRQPVRAGGKDFDAVSVAQGFDHEPKESDGLMLVPLRSPLCATGFSAGALKLLGARTAGLGLVPMQAGAAGAKVQEEEKGAVLEPGGPLAVSLIRGDFDLSGIGTVTHVTGNRVYGWGHPFMSLGGCDLPMMTGYIHTVYPRQTVSFKMGSPLREVGVMHADVSTCIAGITGGKKAEMVPLRMTVAVGNDEPRTFKVEVARHRSLLATLVYTSLVNSVDLEGELPEELTAHVEARIEVEGAEPIVIKDTLSGFSGARAPSAVYSPIASMLNQMTYNPYRDLRIKKIECTTRIEEGRQTAEIEAVELDSSEYRPGDTVRAAVFLKPYKAAARRRVEVALKLPADLPEGEYTATVCDEPTSARADVRGDPTLWFPADTEKVLESIRVQTAARRTTLVLRLPTGSHGVATNGKAMPKLPGSMVHILANSRRTGAMTMGKAVVARTPTAWVIQGGEQVKFTVSKTRKVTRHED